MRRLPEEAVPELNLEVEATEGRGFLRPRGAVSWKMELGGLGRLVRCRQRREQARSLAVAPFELMDFAPNPTGTLASSPGLPCGREGR